VSESEVTREGVQHRIPGRGALTGVRSGWRRRGGEQPVVPEATFTSYYGKPIINGPVWSSPDIPGYFFAGGLAGASSAMALAADLTGRPGLARVSKSGAAVAVALSLAALIHDLGRPGRFLNMLRVLKVTSPMSVGSWLLSAYGPAATVSAGSALTGLLPRIGMAATAGAAALGPVVSTYTAALVSDTAVPAWHDAHREMPFLFAGSRPPRPAAWACSPPRRRRPACRGGSRSGARRWRSPRPGSWTSAWAWWRSPTPRAGRAG
jgi:Polysulphide reductase, NrfD